MDPKQLVLEFVRLLLAWPVMTAVMALTAVLVFKKDIRQLMTRIAVIRFPGGSEVATSQLAKPEATGEGKPTPSVPENDAHLPPALKDLGLTPQQMGVVRQLYLSERANAYLWEYRYLNYFLAYGTQLVLDWFYTNSAAQTLSFFHNVWTPTISSAAERQAILNALQAHFLITIENEMAVITPKGKEYREWRGTVPPLNRGTDDVTASAEPKMQKRRRRRVASHGPPTDS